MRKSVVSGAFYSADKDELLKEFNYFDEVAHKHLEYLEKLPSPKAIIVPHAGYVYSGFTASCAYRAVDISEFEYAIVLGPSHRVYLEGVSCTNFDSYQTPFGELPFAFQAYEKLKSLLTSNIQAHTQEHSTEVQFPLIYHYLNKLPILELIYGKVFHKELCEIVKFAINDPKCLLIVSTDLSHFYTQEEAKSRDMACIKAVESLHVEGMDEKGCEACGKAGVKALLEVSKEKGMKTISLDYRTSGDITGDKERVVGYYSALVINPS